MIVGYHRERRPTVVLCSGYHQRIAPAMHRGVLVHEQLPAQRTYRVLHLKLHASLRLGRSFYISAIVMVTQNGKDTVGGMQLRKHSGMRIDVGRLNVLQVASKAYHVGMLRIDAVDVATKHMGIRLIERTYMRIGEMHDAIALERGRKIGKIQVDMLHFEPMYAPRKAIDIHGDGCHCE